MARKQEQKHAREANKANLHAGTQQAKQSFLPGTKTLYSRMTLTKNKGQRAPH